MRTPPTPGTDPAPTTPAPVHAFHPAADSPTGSASGELDLADLPLPSRFLVSPAPSATPPPGREYRRDAPPGYELVRRLGGGGMGEVYLAKELAPERTVAVKFLKAPASGKAVDRFLVEVRSMAQIDHPNVAKVIAVETNWREPFFTMEYVPGGTLADLLAPGRPPVAPAAAARLVLLAAEGVAAIHSRGILHRDLKPSNILLAGVRRQEPGVKAEESGPSLPTPDARLLTPKVTDFGLAKRTDRDDGVTTGSGALGTPCYMSPEAAAGRVGELGPAADVYGLGATLYHLLTGRPPFGGDPRSPRPEVILQVLSDPLVRPRALRPDIPPELEGVVVKALDRNPGRRYPTADALAADLRRFLAGRRPDAPRLTPLRRAGRWAGRHRARLALAGLAVAAAVGFVAAGLALAPVPPSPVPVPDVAAVVAPAPVPPPPRDPVAEAQKKLAAGQPVTLVGPTGLPEWHAWRLTPSQLGESPTADGSCAFLTNDDTLLELLPDPGINSYRVSAEIRQLRRVAPGGVANLVGTDHVGLYFGAETRDISDGRRVTTLAAVTFQDVRRIAPQAPPVSNFLRVEGGAILQTPKALPYHSTDTAGYALFDPPAAWPGPWRQIVVDVTPDAVRVSWRAELTQLPQPVKAWTGDAFHLWYKGFEGRTAALTKRRDLPPPSWHPRMPLGIWCYQSSVAIRNVIVEPISP